MGHKIRGLRSQTDEAEWRGHVQGIIGVEGEVKPGKLRGGEGRHRGREVGKSEVGREVKRWGIKEKQKIMMITSYFFVLGPTILISISYLGWPLDFLAPTVHLFLDHNKISQLINGLSASYSRSILLGFPRLGGWLGHANDKPCPLL